MALDINRMDYNTYYKTLDEKDMYFTTGVTYVAKYIDPKKHLFKKEPIIYVYHFDNSSKIDYVIYGKLIKKDAQAGLEYSIMGWKIDKDTNMDDVGLKLTASEITCSWETLIPATPIETDLLNVEISNFLNNPTEYLNNKTTAHK